MNIYIDFAKGKIEKVTPAPIYFGDNNVDKITLYFKNIADGVEWYPTLSALCSDNNPIYPRLSDTDGTGTITIDGVDYTYYEFTLSNSNGWNLTPGRTLFYVWINYPNTNGNKCVGTFGCTILGTSGYYQVDNPVVNPALREYLETSFQQHYNEVDEKFDSLEEEFNDEYTEEVNTQRNLINNLIGGEPRYVDTSSNILALTSNQGVAVATDTGDWYYWDGTHYVDGGEFITTNITDMYDWELVNNKYINYSNGSEISYSSEYFNFVKIPVRGNTVVEYNETTSNPDSRGLAFYNENDEFIAGYQMLSTYRTIIAPENSYYLKASVYQTSKNSNLSAGIKIHNLKALSQTTSFNSLNDLYKVKIINLGSGKYVNSTNGVVYDFSVTNYKVIEFKVTNGLVINYNIIGTNDPRGLAFYDENNNFISGYAIKLNETQIIEVPNNAYICRATVTNTNQVEITGMYDLIQGINNRASSQELDKKFGVYDTSYYTITPKKYIDNLGRYIDYNDSNVQAIEFDVIEGMTVEYNATITNSDARGIAFLDKNLNVVSFYNMTSSAQTIIVPDNAHICRATIWNYRPLEENIVVDFSIVGNKLIENYYGADNSMLNVSETPLETLTDDTGMLDIFLNVGCIGDSLASGECVSNEGGSNEYHDLYQYSWGQYLARKTGNTYYNWSKGGLSTASWLASNYATQCFDGEHLCQAYIIGLGQNDLNYNVTVGSSSDIDLTDYNNNANTFYGNYGKIIQKIKEVNPKAKIFVITDMIQTMETNGYNTAIRDMATIFDNVYLMDFYAYGRKYYNNIILSQQMRQSHFNAYGYKICAMMIANYIHWILIKNPSEFKQVEFIGTDWSYN